jgi:CubicO group peptidase (beta-lactamase class C family)
MHAIGNSQQIFMAHENTTLQLTTNVVVIRDMTMRRASLLVTTLFTITLHAAEPNLAGEIDRYLTARTSLGQFSGVALVANRDGVVFRKAYGYANLELRVPNTVDTTFEIASLSKAFTAAAILMLRDDGKLQLDDSVCRFTDPCPEAWKPITIQQLLHHTAGIPDYESALEMGSTKYADAMALSDAPQRFIDAARAKPLDFAPGTKFRYSNTGYLLLGFAIEKASGVPYEQYLQSKIFTPLQLTSTDGITLFLNVNWTVASATLNLGRVTAILQPTSTAAASSKAAGTQSAPGVGGSVPR